MKKSLLFLSMLGLASQAQAQWTQVNMTATPFFGATRVYDVHTLSPTSMWGVVGEVPVSGGAAVIPSSYIRTNNAAGDQFDYNSITVTGNAYVGNISGINATTAVAAAYPSAGYTGASTYGGELRKTSNSGGTWTKVTSATQFTGAGTFCNWVHMFTPLIGVALGDPANSSPTNFEILRTTDGGNTWAAVTGLPPAIANEYGNAGAFFAMGNPGSETGTLWAGLASSVATNPVRVFKTTDFGATWTASTPIANIVGAVSSLAFKNANEGIAFGYVISGGAITGINYAKTTNGGSTWTAFTPTNTATGSLFRYAIDAVGGVYYSVGQRYPAAATPIAADFGSSYSTDGVNWTNLTTSQGYFTLDLIAGPTSGSVVGYAGADSDANGVGGVYKFLRLGGATRDAALQSALNVYPNPSTSGVFNVELGSSLTAGAQLTVVDALGRVVKTQALSATAAGSKTLNLDLSNEKTGVYTLQIRTNDGIATEKVVIN